MDFKDYYHTLGLTKTASADEIKRAYRKLARKYHPDVSKEPEAEARFKEVAEANEALCDVERRAAYDEVAEQHRSGRRGGASGGQPFAPPPGWDSGFEFGGSGADGSDHSDFFEALFGRRGGTGGNGGGGRPQAARPRAGGDHHAKISIDLATAYRGGPRGVALRMPVADPQGRVTLHTRQLEVNIPPGVRNGQHLRLAGQGGAGEGEAPAGDLFLEIEISADARYRLEGRDVSLDLPLAPWEAALGASVHLPLPDGTAIELNVPAGSKPGRRLRLKGKGLPGTPSGDFYAVLVLALPADTSPAAEAAWQLLAASFADFKPRLVLES